MANAIVLCEERLDDNAQKEASIRAKYREQMTVLQAQLGILQAQLDAHEKARDTELGDLDSTGICGFAEASLHLLRMVSEIREKERWVINGSAMVEKWEKAAATIEGPLRVVVDGVRAELEGLVTVPDIVLLARGSGAARGYKARASQLTDFCDVGVMLPGEDWADASRCLLADDLEPIEDRHDDALNDFFRNGVSGIDDYDMKECSVSGSSCISCDLLVSEQQGALLMSEQQGA